MEDEIMSYVSTVESAACKIWGVRFKGLLRTKQNHQVLSDVRQAIWSVLYKSGLSVVEVGSIYNRDEKTIRTGLVQSKKKEQTCEQFRTNLAKLVKEVA